MKRGNNEYDGRLHGKITQQTKKEKMDNRNILRNIRKKNITDMENI